MGKRSRWRRERSGQPKAAPGEKALLCAGDFAHFRAMNWYYAEGDRRLGPISETELLNLVYAGTIKDETLVWKEGMADWTPYLSVKGTVTAATAATARAGTAEPMAGSPTAVVCSNCGNSFPSDEVIPVEGNLVCASCKPSVLQRLIEGRVAISSVVYAGFWIRFGAKFIDGIALWVMQLLIGLVTGMATVSASETQEHMGMILASSGISILVNAAYQIFFNGRFGATPGKMVLGLKIIRADGSPLTYGRATGRFFAEMLDGFTLLIGYIMAAFDDEKRALHDRICDTRVVKP